MDSLRIARGIHLRPPDPSLAARCAALLGAMPVGSVVSGVTAAALHQLWLPPQPVDAPLDITVAASGGTSDRLAYPRRAEVTAHRRRLAVADLARVDGIPLTSVARTWLDLARTLPIPDLVAAGDSALRTHQVASADLAALIESSVDRRGVRAARRALPMLSARSRSRPESHLRVAVTAPDLPPFRVNEAIADEHGQWLAEPDLALDEARLALEYQGADHAEPERMRRDMTRVTDLRRAGWLVLLFGPAEVLRRPQLIAPEVRWIIRARAPHLLGSSAGKGSLPR